MTFFFLNPPFTCYKIPYSSFFMALLLRIRIRWIRKILASWIRIYGAKYQPKTTKKKKKNNLTILLCFKNLAVLRIQLILMRIRIQILDPHWKKWIRIRIQAMNISLRFTNFFKEQEFSNYFSSFLFKT